MNLAGKNPITAADAEKIKADVLLLKADGQTNPAARAAANAIDSITVRSGETLGDLFSANINNQALASVLTGVVGSSAWGPAKTALESLSGSRSAPEFASLFAAGLTSSTQRFIRSENAPPALSDFYASVQTDSAFESIRPGFTNVMSAKVDDVSLSDYCNDPSQLPPDSAIVGRIVAQAHTGFTNLDYQQ